MFKNTPRDSAGETGLFEGGDVFYNQPVERVIWAVAAGIPALALFAELLPVVFGTGEKATWDWGLLYVTIRFVLLPIGGSLAGLVALAIGLFSGARSWQRLRPAVVLLVVAVAYAFASYAVPLPWLVPIPEELRSAAPGLLRR